MHPKIKNRPTGGQAPGGTVKPWMMHDVINLTASANAASLHRMFAAQPASGTANHARHHVSRHAQS